MIVNGPPDFILSKESVEDHHGETLRVESFQDPNLAYP